MLRKVVFEYDDLVIEARVHLGTTSARGDDPDEVISMKINGAVVGDWDLYKAFTEACLIEARSGVVV